MAVEVLKQSFPVCPLPQENRAQFVAAIRQTGEFLTRISAQTATDKMALATLLRAALLHLEEEFKTAVCPHSPEHQVSNIRRAA